MKTRFIVLAGLVASVALLVYLTRGWPFVVRFSQAEVQAKIDAKLPFAPGQGLRLCQLTAARVAFRGDGQVALDAAFRLEAPRKLFEAVPKLGVADRSIDGRISALSRVSYRDGALFLTDVRVEAIHLDAVHLERGDLALGRSLDANRLANAGLAPRALSDHALIERTVSHVLTSFLEDHAVYTLDERHATARLVLREVRVEASSIVVILDPAAAWMRSFLRVVVPYRPQALSQIAPASTPSLGQVSYALPPRCRPSLPSPTA